MSHFRVEVRNISRFFADVEATSEDAARTKALNLARSWKGSNGKPFNPHPVTGSVLQFWPEEKKS